MATVIPVNVTGDRRLKISLGDNVLSIRTYFNRILDYWELDIASDDNVDIANGMNLVAGINLLEWSPFLTSQFGQFRVDVDARGPDSLDRVNFVHFVPGEFEELQDPELFFSPPINYDFEELFPVVVLDA